MAAGNIETKYSAHKENGVATVSRRRFFYSLLIIAALVLCGCTSGEQQSLEITSGQNEQGQENKKESQDNPEKEVTARAAEDTSGQVTVYVCGAVCRPGVYTLDETARMAQAVEAAGGMLETADVNALNLAQFLSDGQMIRIPLIGEAQQTQETQPEAQDGQPDGRININQADAAQLQKIPGVGQAKADAIIRYREENGNFKSIEDIMQIDGIKEASYAKMKDYICVN